MFDRAEPIHRFDAQVAELNDTSDPPEEIDFSDPFGYNHNFYNGDGDDHYQDAIAYFGEGAFWYDLSENTAGIPSWGGLPCGRITVDKVAFYGEKQLLVRDPDGYSLCFQSPAERA